MTLSGLGNRIVPMILFCQRQQASLSTLYCTLNFHETQLQRCRDVVDVKIFPAREGEREREPLDTISMLLEWCKRFREYACQSGAEWNGRSHAGCLKWKCPWLVLDLSRSSRLLFQHVSLSLSPSSVSSFSDLSRFTLFLRNYPSLSLHTENIYTFPWFYLDV